MLRDHLGGSSATERDGLTGQACHRRDQRSIDPRKPAGDALTAGSRIERAREFTGELGCSFGKPALPQ